MADRNKELLERHAVLQSPARIEELAKVFIHATKVSYPIRCSRGRMQPVRVLTGCRWKLRSGRCTVHVELALDKNT